MNATHIETHHGEGVPLRTFPVRLLSYPSALPLLSPISQIRSPRRRGAFTLIEVMLAIAIMAVICGTIYQFTGTVIRTSDVSMRMDVQQQAFAGLRRLLDAQFAALPTSENNMFIGITKEGKNGHLDALQVVCPAGNAVLSPDAKGLYRVTLGLDEIPRGSGHYTLVMERKPWDEEEDANPNATEYTLPAISAGGFKTAQTQLPADSVPLLDGVSSLEIAYYDPRLNSWQDKWNDDTLIPSLVRVRLSMESFSEPYEFIEQIPGGGIRRGLPSILTTSVINQPVFTVPGTNGTVPALPPGLKVPALPPGGLTPPTFSPNVPLNFPNAPLRGGTVVTPQQ